MSGTVGKPIADILLGVSAAPDRPLTEKFEALTVDGWEELLQSSSDLRVSALVLRNLETARQEGLAPSHVLQALQGLRRQMTLYALGQAKGAARLSQFLTSKGFEPVLLKGFALAYGAYPAAVLRPLRDVDILLDRDEAAAAQDALLKESAYDYLPKKHQGAPRHHLRQLTDLETGLTIEIHHGISASGRWAHEDRLVRRLLSDTRTVDLLGQSVRVPLPLPNLLHLIAHSGLEHCLDNGPVTLADMHFLLAGKTREVGCDVLMHECEAIGLRNSLLLLAALARRHGATWVDGELAACCSVAEPLLEAATHAALPKLADAEDIKLARKLDRQVKQMGWRAPFAMMMSPDRKMLADIVGVAPDSPWRWLGYPGWLLARARRFIAARRNTRSSGLGAAERDLTTWLQIG